MIASDSHDRDFGLVCPACFGPLEEMGPNLLLCRSDLTSYHRQAGVWRFLSTGEEPGAARFLEDYKRLRSDEGWGSEDPEYYRGLPYEDLSGRHPEVWRIRAASFEVLRQRVLSETCALGQGARIADLGAGNCWLSWRLSVAGHRVVAVDVSGDARDGLGAGHQYGGSPDFLRLQAGFDEVPLADSSIDLAIFNGSLHYSNDYLRTLSEASRMIRPDGCIVIMDTPMYRWRASGERMLEERRQIWRDGYGPDFAAELTEGFLTRSRLHELGAALGWSWRIHRLPLGLRWRCKPLVEVLRGRREPARFPLLVGRRI